MVSGQQLGWIHEPHPARHPVRERLGAALGTAASLADFVLLQREAYATGSSGQAITFVAYGLASVVLAVRLSKRFLKPQE